MTRCSLSSQVPLSPSCFLAVERFCVLKESFTCAAPTTQSPSRDLWLTPPSLSISYFLPRCSPIAHFPLVVSSIPPFILQPLPIPVHIIVFLRNPSPLFHPSFSLFFCPSRWSDGSEGSSGCSGAARSALVGRVVG